MNRARILIVAALLIPTVAHADERHPTIDLEAGAAGIIQDPDDYDAYGEPDSLTILRARVGWEPVPIAYPEAPGYAWGGALVPEVSIGMIDHQDQGETFIMAGLRLDALMAQKEMGLLKVSVKSGMWLAGRVGVLGEHRDAMYEIAFGWHLWLGNSKWRLGWQVGWIGIHGQQQNDAVPVPGTLNFDTGSDDQVDAVHMTIFVGGQL